MCSLTMSAVTYLELCLIHWCSPGPLSLANLQQSSIVSSTSFPTSFDVPRLKKDCSSRWPRCTIILTPVMFLRRSHVLVLQLHWAAMEADIHLFRDSFTRTLLEQRIPSFDHTLSASLVAGAALVIPAEVIPLARI